MKWNWKIISNAKKNIIWNAKKLNVKKSYEKYLLKIVFKLKSISWDDNNKRTISEFSFSTAMCKAVFWNYRKTSLK